MLTNRRRLATTLFAALMLTVLALGVTACGSGNPRSVDEGEVVKVGGLKYTVIFSRYLNPNDSEDAAYLKGLEPAKSEKNYFGVFLLVQNTSHETKGLAEQLTITSSTEERFKAIQNESEFGFPFGGTVEENEQVPELDTTAQVGPIEGSVAIFELPEEVSANRPLLLHIPGPPKESGTVELDL